MSTKTYNAEHMEEISSRYNQCASAAQKAVYALARANICLQNNYQGQGSEIAEEAYLKTKEHLQLLQECLAQAEKYVIYTKETAQAMDNKIAGHSGGGGSW